MSRKILIAASVALWVFSVASPGMAAVGSAEVKQLAFEVLDRNADQIALIGDSVFYFGELGMQEFETTKFIKETLEGSGFKFEAGIAGMPTAWVATWGSGKPVIAILAEFDALPGGSQTPGVTDHKPLVQGAPGHMEGHNTMTAVALGAAYAVKRAMERYNLPGTIRIVGGPAEEQTISRPHMIRAGVFKDVDLAFFVHVRDIMETSYGLSSISMVSVEFTFKGRTAHAAIAPWEGRDALDAAELMSIGVDKLREHLKPTHRVHRVITYGGDQPNVIPDRAVIWWFFRDLTAEGVKEIHGRAMDVARGAALMTGTTVETKVLGSAWPRLANRELAEVLYKNMQLVGMPKWSQEEIRLAKEIQRKQKKPEVGLMTKLSPIRKAVQFPASNDVADVTWVVPTGELNFPANIPGTIPHHWTAGIAPATSIAHKGEVAGAKILAGAILDVLTTPELVAKAKAQFEQDTKETKYFSLLPPDARPPLELNRGIMEKYRPEMRGYYLNRKVQFR